MKMPAGCWCSWPFGRSWPPWPKVAVIPGTSAGKWLFPRPTQIVISTTLAPETGEVSWVAWGFGGFYSSPKLIRIRRSPRISRPAWRLLIFRSSLGDLPAVSGRAGSRTEPARGCSTVASRRLAPRNLSLSKFGATLLLV
jgi:hypothetical protein